MTAPDRRCGTCKWWERSKAHSEMGYCEWPKAHLPASIATRPMMHEDEGTDCSQWSDGADAVEGGDE